MSRAPLPGAVPFDAILFDLDGTLVDSVPDLHLSVEQMLADLGRHPCGEEAVRSWVGNGVDRLVERALGEPPPRALKERALQSFRAHYRANNGVRSRLYPGAKACLTYLRAHRVPAGCVTNKPSAFTLPLLTTLGLLEDLGIVVSGDDLAHRKPDAEPLLHAAEALGADAQRTLFVGDSSNDVEAARAAGMPIWCVPYGYNHGRPIEASSPDRVIPSLEALPGLWGATMEPTGRAG